ncbi:MAG: DUF3667 domain-containing protein [Flavobacteriaceae bacterium]|nr:DUF3667 domain-containing protein [Flavobacteriaceae bacterium]
MSEQAHNEKCKQCNNKLFGDFCSNCGQPQRLKRIDGQYIISEIGSVLNFDKGILFTIRELLLRPGLSIRKFILDDRNRLVKPVVFIIITSLIYTIFQQLFHFEDGYTGYSTGEGNSATLSIFNWISNNYGYSNILMAIFTVLWIKIFFRNYNYNFFEILILLFFLMGIGMLMFSIFGVISSLIEINILDKGGAIITILYISWGIGQFFDKGKIVNYFKGFLSYMLGMISFAFMAQALGILIDMINKSS